MVVQLQQLQRLDARGQAVQFHRRERRRSLAGVPELHRTHQIFGGTSMPVANIDAAQFPAAVRDRLVTFKTAIRITAGAGVAGLVFELGDSAIGLGAWLGSQTLGFHAGEDGVVNGATALFDNGAAWPNGLELDLVFAVRPGDGRVVIWGNGQELARSQASSETFGAAGTWANGSNGAFAAAAQGTTPVDVLQTGAPTNFEVIEPLSAFVGSVPRHFY